MTLIEMDRFAAMLSMLTDDELNLFISRCDDLDPEIMDRLWDNLSEGSDAVSFTPDFKLGMQ
jgi:hypothetical protein